MNELTINELESVAGGAYYFRWSTAPTRTSDEGVVMKGIELKDGGFYDHDEGTCNPY
ncbi:MAG: CCRG-2 family RiPP [Burkholderiales bacterium]|nr:CCRG-2 family RiPP [Burkholderiales bacterium]MDR4516977.1 CCRG-2 family RiPP [Nitrosomonas sp.]